MRSALLAVSLLTGALAVAGCADGSSGTAPAAVGSSLTVGGEPSPSAAATTTPVAGTPVTIQAGTGTEMFGVPDVTVRITTCDTDTELATVVTDRDGTATQGVTEAGCYRATVLSVPGGCHPNEVASSTVVVKLGEPASTRFLIHCA
ncbi:hypothetical protein [Nocardia harenae]|uniref:hypothetical protein n=1 Tax=Nocardia harenae TaxID=358707 RepID=UPI00083118D1|nr:hypothetical protein [Nocardia harenae]